jgi:deazaflavin-dependent oxidoreductase (nitroreductase family)
VQVLLLTVPGRRTGANHTVPVCFVERDGAWLVTASAGGSKDEPQWFRNLRATERAEVQIGERHISVDVSIPEAADRDRAWEHVLHRAPFFAAYERKSGRTIPVAVLRPLDAFASLTAGNQRQP